MNIIEQLKQYEGTIQYQQHIGTYRNGKFYPYNDSLGYPTIGYGHLILSTEDYSTGITEQQADELLQHDIDLATHDAGTLNIPDGSPWHDFIIMMVFQLGITKTRKFVKFLAAVRNGDNQRASTEIRNSKWYQQTQNRVDSMLKYVLGE
ncbi:glycoside hydrolase family protein [Edwardsiella tarda]|uniref:glycoside hydrolase family protein n=1 Tax=Edwardsiella tarda TaxID=636 RepID=UPI00351BEC91